MRRIGFILKDRARDAAAPVITEVLRLLRRRNMGAELIVPAAQLIDLARIEVRCDLYVLRPGVELGLSVAGILHDKGARLINSFAASSLTHDKARVTAILEADGIPTPPSFIAGGARHAGACVGQGPVIVKPHRGSAGEGIRVVRTQADLDGQCGDPIYLQRYLASDGEDLKVYVVGDEIFSIKRPFPARSYDEMVGRPCIITSRIRDIALRCGRLLGLEIYGVDFLETAQGPVVVDVNYMPGMIGVKRAPEAIADYLGEHAAGRLPQRAIPLRQAGRPYPR